MGLTARLGLSQETATVRVAVEGAGAGAPALQTSVLKQLGE